MHEYRLQIILAVLLLLILCRLLRAVLKKTLEIDRVHDCILCQEMETCIEKMNRALREMERRGRDRIGWRFLVGRLCLKGSNIVRV